ncbi:MAG: hypothetical protein P4L95_09160 [Rouxiella aceris]|uniref:hypothetical protein n=1 Tax=Rouxiella aceris TaxID=2703884 RepID=UPI00284593B9|nr:hypothetical protein [Rouxiella aceris]MDR3432052.1 hypothetical protein [Rouxiella aceris]
MIYVQFADDSEESIVAIFSCPQDASQYQNQGKLDITDKRYHSFYQLLSESVQQLMPSPA